MVYTKMLLTGVVFLGIYFLLIQIWGYIKLNIVWNWEVEKMQEKIRRSKRKRRKGNKNGGIYKNN